MLSESARSTNTTVSASPRMNERTGITLIQRTRGRLTLGIESHARRAHNLLADAPLGQE